MKELSKKTFSNSAEGLACGPMGTYEADAEILIEDEGHKIYLFAQWIDEVNDTIYLEATTKSLLACYKKLAKHINDSDDTEFEKLLAEREKIVEDYNAKKIFGDIDIKNSYPGEYEKLLAMLQEVLDKDKIGFDIEALDWKDEDEDEDEDENEDEDGDEE